MFMRARAVAVAAVLLLSAFAAFAVTNPPVITQLSPVDTIAGTGQLDVEVFGANFISGAVVRVNNANRPTTFVDSGHLRVTLITTDVQTPGTLNFVVANPSGGGVSGAVSFTVLPNNPTLTSLNPATVLTGSGAFTLHVTGSNFASNAIVRVNNANRTTTFIDSSHLDAAILASDVSSSRTLTITVLNPNNKTSNSLTITVSTTVPSPTITQLSPDTVPAGSLAFDLTVLGTNFVSGAAVRVNGNARTTTFTSATQLVAHINTSDVSAAGTPAITVRNPDGKISNSVNLTVTAANQPQLTSISPSSVIAKSGAFTLTATGTNFINGAKINVGATAHTTTFISATTLTTTITSSEITNPGQLSITVTNPGSGAPTSSAQILNVTAADAPVVNSINPVSVIAGSGTVNVLINGSGFVSTDTVYFSGSQRVFSFINSTQVAISLLASDTATVGQFPITVKHINGSTSAPAIFNVSDGSGGPVVTSISPNTAAVNGAPFTLNINGTGFTDESIVSFDGTPRTTTFVSVTKLTVPVFASDLTSARQIAVTVLTPGFPQSTPVPLTIAVIPPVITGINPNTVTAGSSGFTLTVNGTGFSSSAVININGTSKLTQFDSATGSVSTSLIASEIATAASLAVTVTDRGITSNTFNLTVARPFIALLSPPSATAGSGDLTLVVQGSAFLSTSIITFNGVDKPTAFNSASGTLSTTLTAAELALPRIVAVTVRNTATAESIPVLFSIVSPGAPQILSLTPSSADAGSGAQIVIVGGVNFLSSSQVAVNGTIRTTTFDNANQLEFTLTPADLAAAGTLSITVVNQDGTISPAFTFVVNFNGPPPPRRRSAPH
jgi:hypothetical protein